MKRTLVQSFFIASLVLSNVVAAKLLQIGGLVVPGAFLLYAFTFLATDYISEVYGRKEASRLVLVGFVVSVFGSLMILLTQWLPYPEWAAGYHEAYVKLLGQNWRIVLGSMLAYYASQTWDLWVFEKVGKLTNGKHKWLRNNLSTMSSQLIDTAIFITIAFAGNVPELGLMLVSQYIVKVCVALLDTPVFYWLTRNMPSVFVAEAEPQAGRA